MGLFDKFKKKDVPNVSQVDSQLPDAGAKPQSLYNELDVAFGEGLFYFIDCPVEKAIERVTNVLKITDAPIKLSDGAIKLGALMVGTMGKWTVFVSHELDEDAWDNHTDAESRFLQLAQNDEAIYARYNEDVLSCYFIALRNGKIVRLFCEDMDYPDMNKNEGQSSVGIINDMDNFADVTAVIQAIIQNQITNV